MQATNPTDEAVLHPMHLFYKSSRRFAEATQLFERAFAKAGGAHVRATLASPTRALHAGAPADNMEIAESLLHCYLHAQRPLQLQLHAMRVFKLSKDSTHLLWAALAGALQGRGPTR